LVTVASGQSTLTRFAVNVGACTTAATMSAPGVATKDAIIWSYASEPAIEDGNLILSAYPTSGNVNFKLCNPTAQTLTPSGLIVNWRVVR
jgi:hypothetical protein